jgi:hypothetical protein
VELNLTSPKTQSAEVAVRALDKASRANVLRGMNTGRRNCQTLPKLRPTWSMTMFLHVQQSGNRPHDRKHVTRTNIHGSGFVLIQWTKRLTIPAETIYILCSYGRYTTRGTEQPAHGPHTARQFTYCCPVQCPFLFNCVIQTYCQLSSMERWME